MQSTTKVQQAVFLGLVVQCSWSLMLPCTLAVSVAPQDARCTSKPHDGSSALQACQSLQLKLLLTAYTLRLQKKPRASDVAGPGIGGLNAVSRCFLSQPKFCSRSSARLSQSAEQDINVPVNIEEEEEEEEEAFVGSRPCANFSHTQLHKQRTQEASPRVQKPKAQRIPPFLAKRSGVFCWHVAGDVSA